MKHSWGEWENAWGIYVSECAVCGGYRVQRKKDYSGSGKLVDRDGRVTGYLDGAPAVVRGWQYDKTTPRSCPGERLPEVELSEEENQAGLAELEKLLADLKADGVQVEITEITAPREQTGSNSDT